MAKAEKSEDPKVTYLEVLMEAKHVDTDNIIMSVVESDNKNQQLFRFSPMADFHMRMVENRISDRMKVGQQFVLVIREP